MLEALLQSRTAKSNRPSFLSLKPSARILVRLGNDLYLVNILQEGTSRPGGGVTGGPNISGPISSPLHPC
jgi:hypothetical protein